MLEKSLFLLLGALIGTFLGHRFSLGRDRRKEYNHATQPMRDLVTEYVVNPTPQSKFPEFSEVARTADHLPKRKRKAFADAWDHLHEAKKKAEQRDGYGGVWFDDVSEIQKCAQQILRFIKRK